MNLKNHIIKLPKVDNITVDYIESEIKKHGEPLRWAIVKADEELVIDAVVIE